MQTTENKNTPLPTGIDSTQRKKMKQFAQAKITQLQSSGKNIPGPIPNLWRTLLLSKEMATRINPLFFDRTAEFLDYIFGEETGFTERTQFPGNMIFKLPGKTLHQSFNNWFFEKILSLNTTQLVQCFHLWLNQIPTVQLLNSVESTYNRQEVRRVLQESRRLFTEKEAGGNFEGNRIAVSGQISREKLTRSERLQFLQTLENVLNTVYKSPTEIQSSADSIPDTFATIFQFLTLASPRPVQARLSSSVFNHESRDRALLTTQARDKLDFHRRHVTHRIDSQSNAFYFSEKAGPIPLAGLTDTIREFATSIETEYLKPYFADSSVSPRLSPRKNRERHELSREKAKAGITRKTGTMVPPSIQKFVFSSENVYQWPENLQKVERLINDTVQTKIPARERMTSFQQNYSTGSEESRQPGRTALWPSNVRELITVTQKKQDIAAEASPENHFNYFNHFTFLRKEETLPPPPHPFVYTQPTRPRVEEENVVKRVQEKEVVQIVKKEVETLFKSHSLIDNLSRADFGKISDQVYSSLARRLMMEKERLGLN